MDSPHKKTEKGTELFFIEDQTRKKRCKISEVSMSVENISENSDDNFGTKSSLFCDELAQSMQSMESTINHLVVTFLH